MDFEKKKKKNCFKIRRIVCSLFEESLFTSFSMCTYIVADNDGKLIAAMMSPLITCQLPTQKFHTRATGWCCTHSLARNESIWFRGKIWRSFYVMQDRGERQYRTRPDIARTARVVYTYLRSFARGCTYACVRIHIHVEAAGPMQRCALPSPFLAN